MGYRQHLVRSLLPIRDQGRVRLDDGTTIFPEPVLVGRSEERLRQIAERHGIQRWTTSLDDVLSDPGIDIYFDAQVTTARQASLRQAIAAGKHVYTEKPVADSLEGALQLARPARAGAPPPQGRGGGGGPGGQENAARHVGGGWRGGGGGGRRGPPGRGREQRH